jgi:curved DNA-binding protein
MDPLKDFYKTLGVSRSASEDEIRKAFRRLARRYHPDTQPDDPLAGARFKELTEAYDVLGDPPRRRAYDAAFSDGASQGEAKRSGLDASLSGLFGAASAAPRRGADLEVEAEVTLEQVLTGTAVTLSLTPPSGEVRRLRVKIPPGVENNTVVRLPREGDPGDFGGPAGDLLVRVSVQSHPTFQREGANLAIDLPVSVFDAVLGGRVQCPSLQGPLALDIPPGTQGNAVFRFSGHGLPRLKGGGRGDLEARVYLVVPSGLDEAQRLSWERLAGQAPMPL